MYGKLNNGVVVLLAAVRAFSLETNGSELVNPQRSIFNGLAKR